MENVQTISFVIKTQEIVQRVANPTFCPHFAKVYLIEISIFTVGIHKVYSNSAQNNIMKIFGQRYLNMNNVYSTFSFFENVIMRMEKKVEFFLLGSIVNMQS